MPDHPHAEPLRFGLAQTPDERNAVYRFRYAQYYRKLPASPGVDHARGLVYLPLDEQSAHLVGCGVGRDKQSSRNGDNGLVITGTGVRASAPGIPEEWRRLLRLDVLAALNLDEVLIFSRLVAHEACRGSLVFPAFFQYAARYFMERGYAYSIHYCAPALVPLYERIGYRVYGQGRAMESGLFRIPMILAVADKDYLAKVCPALAKAVGHIPAAGDVAAFRALLPETTGMPLCARESGDRLALARAIASNVNRRTEDLVPDAAAKALRRAFILTLQPGDSPAHPMDQPLLWFVLQGEMAVRGKDGTESRALPGTCINGHAVASFCAPKEGKAGGKIIVLAPGRSPEFKDAVLPTSFWRSLA